MGDQKAWKAKDGTIFIEREDGGREIVTGPEDDRKLYQTSQQSDDVAEDFEDDE